MGKPAMTGYEKEDRYYATRYRQGGRTVYSIELSLAGVAATLPKPNPARLTEDNRRINDSHARGFGDYVRTNTNWVAPALLLRSSDIFEFEAMEEVGGVEFGILSMPRLARTDLRILDGQHRTLGLHYAVEGVAAELEKARSLLTAAKKQENGEVVKSHEKQIKQLQDQRTRLDRERISVQIYVEDQPEAFKQMFVDIAANALGVTSTLKARFDHRKVVNRALDSVVEHALLKGHVDLQQDRVMAGNPNLLGAKHVAEIIRTVTVGISGRVGRRQEEELHEASLAEKANNFLDVVVAGFPEMNEVVDGRMTPERLRKSSLLGSTTMLRVLAGVYHELSKQESDDEIIDFFEKLAPHMKAPITEESPWFRLQGEVFSVGTVAPKARYQDMNRLVETIAGWARQVPSWLAA